MCYEVVPHPPGRRILQWSVDVEHCTIARLTLRLVLELGGARGCTSTPICSVEVKAEAAEQSEELALCHGALYFRSPIDAHVEWLGRSGHRAVHRRVRGSRCVATKGFAEDLGPGDGTALDELPPRTVAETLLGIVVSIFQLLGTAVVQLQALDDGSERLVNFYMGFGFIEKSRVCKKRTTGHPKDGQTVSMDALVIGLVANLVPAGSQAAAWFAALLPRSFDAKGWLRQGVQQLWCERLRAGSLPRFEFRTAWPPRSQLDLQLYRFVAIAEYPTSKSPLCVGAEEHGFIMDIGMKDVRGNELIYGYGMVFPNLRLLSIIWLGRSESRSTASFIRGHAAYGTRAGVEVTAAAALMGLMAAVALWFGVSRAELRVPEAECGKLTSYLRTFGLRSPELKPPAADAAVLGDASRGREDWWLATSAPAGGDELGLGELTEHFPAHACGGIRHEQLLISCEALAYRCCPPEWHTHLLQAEDHNRSAEPAPPTQVEPHQAAVRSALMSIARCGPA